MADDDRPRPGRTEATEDVHIRTFLIADVRGYTLFTQERGDEAATKLAARFADVARQVVKEHGGSVIELRGDEALAVFSSARQAILAAAHAQDRFLEETVADPSFPLPVGIGLDAGEAVPLEAGYRGGALNLAARLCGRAGPGEILASQAVVHLARKVEGVRYVDRGDLHLKGLADPVRVFRAISEEGDPAQRFRQFAPGRQARGPAPIRLARRHPAMAIVVAVALIAVAAVPTTIALRGGAGETILGDAVALIDLDSGELIDDVPLDSRPGAVAVGEGGVWVTLPDRGKVVEIDPEEPPHVIDTVDVGADPVGVAVSDDSIWVANAGSSNVSRISPSAGNEIVDTIDVPGGAAAIVVSPDGMWVANSVGDTVSRIDPAKGEVVETIVVDDQPVALAAYQAGLWVANARSGTVSHISTGPPVTVQPAKVGNAPQAIAVGLGSIWVANFLDGTVDRIDPATGSIDRTFPVGAGPSGLAISHGSVWISKATEGAVKKLDSETGDVETIRLGSQAAGIAAGSSALWVGVRGAQSAHRGGTLSVESLAYLMHPIDPAVAYSPDTWNLLSLTNDGLLGFRREAGIEGATLVPALATTIPDPTDGGRTYTFQLRPGIRYSSGDPVIPEDVRGAIERLFETLDPDGEPSGGVPYFSGIVGAEDCMPGTPCDLSSGIVADDDAGTVSFHLRAPDPDFLFKLTMPFAFVVPAGTPAKLAPDAPVPATGPYVIDHYAVGKEIVLVRNPHFRPWSSSRPDGFPDRIVWRLGQRVEPMVAHTLSGRTDLLVAPLGGQLVATLGTNHAPQLHLDPMANTGYLFLNVQVPPFNDERVRQALNYAIDRRAVVHDVFGARGEVTCQILPPTLPGFHPYCPYTSDPDGTWSGPDLTRAKKLVDRSGTAGSQVTVWIPPPRERLPEDIPLADHVVELLDTLGYHARRSGGKLSDAQIGYSGWFTDYPAESAFIPPTLACDSSFNLGHFCDPEIDARMRKAARLATIDSHQSHELWSQIEHDLVDRALWVPLINARFVTLASRRLGNHLFSPALGPLIDQMWVR
jgi:ABC-type transport system substrate-binding protein/class 3 adenylate cyclase/DNA-binding beta-propeller fold protein YncE